MKSIYIYACRHRLSLKMDDRLYQNLITLICHLFAKPSYETFAEELNDLIPHVGPLNKQSKKTLCELYFSWTQYLIKTTRYQKLLTVHQAATHEMQNDPCILDSYHRHIFQFIFDFHLSFKMKTEKVAKQGIKPLIRHFKDYFPFYNTFYTVKLSAVNDIIEAICRDKALSDMTFFIQGWELIDLISEGLNPLVPSNKMMLER